MDLGCYGLHIMRMFGPLAGGSPQVTGATAAQRTPGIDASCDVDLRFPTGATGRACHTMVSDAYRFTFEVVGTAGTAVVHDFIKPHHDDRLTVSTPAGTRVEHLGTRTTYAYQLEAFADHVRDGGSLPINCSDAVANMALIDDAYRAAGMQPR